jgi:putative membrane-bound dehydrogenase-like protein
MGQGALVFALALLFATAPGTLAIAAAGTGPLPPDQALKSFVTDPGLSVELVAAEPLVASPAALAWDGQGRLFVAENPGYPTGPGPGRPPVGTIVELVDSEGDGQADRRIVFAEGLGFPNGILPWRNGLLITDAPDLVFLADTDGDGRADVREVWFTGFATNQTTQLRACYPTLGPDGWIYVARGLSAGVVQSPKWPQLPAVDLKDGDFRFRPDGSAAEAIGGNAQFGLVVDDLNRRFLVSNRNPLMHAVVHPRSWQRNPALGFTDLIHNVSPIGYDAKVHPRSPDTTTAGFMPELMAAPHAGTFTAACGIHQYWGEGLGPDYAAHWFLCEPAQNLVQRQIATPDGPSFSSRPATPGRDFLTSTDGWFRPVFAATGPDGGLYLADMYRGIIDHPDYLPEDIRGKLDFSAGKDLGRLWRIRRTDSPRGTTRQLAKAGSAELVEALGATNVWIRQTAFRLLTERPADTNVLASVVARIEQTLPRREQVGHWSNLVRHATDPAFGPHIGTARRLWLLHHLLHPSRLRPGQAGELGNRAVFAMLGAALHESPAVRETFWRMAQESPVDPKHALPDVPYELVYAWAEDPNPAVRFQFALQCGQQDDWTPVLPALVRVARLDATNRWTRAAVLSGLKGRQNAFVRELFERPPEDTPAFAELLHDLGRMAPASQEGTGWIKYALSPAADQTAWQTAALSGLAEGLRSSGQPGLPVLFRNLASSQRDTTFRDFPDRLREIGRQAVQTATNTTARIPQRLAALRFLAELDYSQAGPALGACLAPAEPLDIQTAAARSLGRFDDLEVGRLFTERAHWNAFPQPVREIALAALLSRPALISALLDAIEREDLPVWTVDPQRRRQLQNHSQTPLRDRARKIFANVGGEDRLKVFNELKPVLALPASGTRGHAVFTRTCANCHAFNGEGVQVGPELTGVRNQPAAALLLHILVPDAEIYPGFQACGIETRDGRSLIGVLISDTAEAVVIRAAGGEQETIRRSNIAAFELSRLSLMPQELEKTMTRQELADLVAFLRGQP